MIQQSHSWAYIQTKVSFKNIHVPIVKDKIMPFAATWMELETLILSEVRKGKTNTTYIQNLIYGTKEHFHRKENHGLGKQTCGCLMGGGGSGRDWELGLIRHNLEWIYKEILLNSIENYVQILMLQQKKGEGKNIIVMYRSKDNLTPLLYSGKKKKRQK